MVERPRDIDGLGLSELKTLLVQALEEVARLRQENQMLRGEIARLKGLSGRPRFRPSGMEKKSEERRRAKAARKANGALKLTRVSSMWQLETVRIPG